MYLVAFPSALVSICQPNWLPRLDTPPWRCRSWISRAVVSSWRARCLPSVSVTRLTHLDGSGVFAVKDSFMVGIKMYILEYPVYIYIYIQYIHRVSPYMVSPWSCEYTRHHKNGGTIVAIFPHPEICPGCVFRESGEELQGSFGAVEKPTVLWL